MTSRWQSRLRPRPGSSRLPVDPDLEAGDDVIDVFAPQSHGREQQPFRAWSARRGRIYAAIFVGGFVGGSLRYVLDKTFPDPLGRFPWTVFMINISGSFVLTLALVLIIDLWQPGPLVRPFLATGLIGAFTTFSTYVVAADRIWSTGNAPTAVTYVVASAIAGLAAASFGLVLGRGLVTVRAREQEGQTDAP